MSSSTNDKNKKPSGYKDTGIHEDTLMTATDVSRTALNFVDFVPGGRVVRSAAAVGDVALAGVQGDLEAEKYTKHLAEDGIDVNSTRAKWNPAIKSRMEKLRDRWKGRMGEAVVSAGGASLGAWAGSAAAGAAAGTMFGPLGTVAGGAVGLVGGGLGAMATGYATSRVYNKFVPINEQDAVDLTVKIVDAQKAGQEIPAEVIFAQWAAQQNGVMEQRLKNNLSASTGLTNFNDAIEQGKMAELNAIMNKPEYKNAMAASIGMMPDAQDPDKHVAAQLSEWINSGRLPAKDLLLKSQMPVMSLADAQREGYIDDPITVPALQMGQNRGRSSPDYTMAV